MLEEAINIADKSVRGRSNPTMSASDAAGIVFALLVSGWNKSKIIADLDVLQTGIDREGGNRRCSWPLISFRRMRRSVSGVFAHGPLRCRCSRVPIA